jgi:hypothetical protein
MFDPHMTVSGRSVVARIVIVGFWNKHISSCTVPESLMANLLLRSRLTQSKNPMGSDTIIRLFNFLVMRC